MKVRVELTVPQALALREVAGNGYGDGDYYSGGRAGERVFLNAMRRLEDAIERVRGEFAHRVTGKR